VRGGAYQNLGMPMFSWLTEEDIEGLRAYLLSRRDALLE
jgi:hypothetical protein